MTDLKKLLDTEKQLLSGTKFPELGFDDYELGLTPQDAKRLLNEGILQIVYRSNKHTSYRVNSEAVGKILRDEQEIQQLFPKETGIPDDLFNTIVGFDDIKENVLSFIQRGQRGGFVFIGPPASAKTLFLMEIGRLPGSMYITASSATKVGIRDILLDEEPDYLCIDELDKASNKDFDALLSLSETGIVQKNTHSVRQRKILKTQVFAAANRDTLSREMKSRYVTLHIPEYSRPAMANVGMHMLVEREHLSEDVARYVVGYAISEMHVTDVRDFLKVARLRQDDTLESVKKAIEFMNKYSR